jgi:hypothetical protein
LRAPNAALQVEPSITATSAGPVLSSSLTGCDCLSAPVRDNSRWRLSFDDSAVIADQLVFRFQVGSRRRLEEVPLAALAPGSRTAWPGAAR